MVNWGEGSWLDGWMGNGMLHNEFFPMGFSNGELL